MSSNSMVAADNSPSGMPRLLPALAGCWGSSLVLEGRSLIHHPCSAGGRSGNRSTLDRLSEGQGAFNRCQADLRAQVEQAIGPLATAGRCAAGAGCCSGFGTSTGPPARWSASAGSCTRAHLKEHRRHLIGLYGLGRPMRLLPSSGTTGRPGRLGYVVRHHPLGCTFQAPQAALAVDWRAHVADPGRTAVLGRASLTADVAAPDPSVELAV
jgi:hypothetical protein